MKPDVSPSPEHPAGGWDEDAITAIDPRGPRAARHRNLLRAALLLFDPQVLWDNKTRQHWKVLTGKDDASTKTFCDAIRESGINVGDMLR